jgi:hypothetical protein
VWATAFCRSLLIAVDGLILYPDVVRDAFRTVIPRLVGLIGRMTLMQWPEIAIAQVMKSRQLKTWNIQSIIA